MALKDSEIPARAPKTNSRHIRSSNAPPFFSLAIFITQTRISQGIPHWESILSLSNRCENRSSLAIFDRKEIAHLAWGLTNCAILRGSSKIAATTAENRGARSFQWEPLLPAGGTYRTREKNLIELFFGRRLVAQVRLKPLSQDSPGNAPATHNAFQGIANYRCCRICSGVWGIAFLQVSSGYGGTGGVARDWIASREMVGHIRV